MPYLAPETLPATFVCRRLRIPNDLQFLMAVNGALVELTRVWNWEQTGDVTPEQASEVANLMLRDFWLSECPDETPEPGEKLVFGPDASLITYAPQDPYTAASIVPAGYVFPPLYVIEPETLPFPGVQTGDVLTDLSKLPTAWPPLLPPGGYPRFRVNFHVTGPGPGEVELHLVKIPTAGLALVTLDGDPATADFIDLSTADLLDLTDLGALLGTALDGDLVRTHIQELHVAEVGDHFIDVTFLPKIGTSSLIGFGGGLRQVVLGGTAGAGEMPAPQFRLTGTMLEWRPHEAHVWLELGDLGAEVGAAIETTEVVPVTWEDPPSLVFDAEEKKLTLTLPVGYPPVNDIQSTVVNHNVGDTQTTLVYDEMLKRLTLNEQSPWFRGIRTEGYNPTLLQVNTYQDPETWVTIASIPSTSAAGGLAIAPPPVPQSGATDDENKCLASKGAVEVLKRTYNEIASTLAGTVTNTWDVASLMALGGAGLLNMGAAMIGSGIGLGLVLLAEDQYRNNPLDETFLEQMLAMFYVAAHVDEDGVVTWDVDEIYAALDIYHAGDLDQRWMNMKYLIQVIGEDGLNAAGAVDFGQVADCYTPPAGWEFTVDFTEEAGPWVPQLFNGCTTTRTSEGFQPCGSTQDVKIQLLNPGGYDPARVIDSWSVTYRATEPGRSGTAIQMIAQIPGAPSPGFNHDGTTGIKTQTVTGPWTGFNGLVLQGFFIEILSATVRGPVSPHPWE